METKFQTSFIPKRPVPFAQPGGAPVQPHHHTVSTGGGSIFMTIAVVLFVASILSIGGAYLWKAYLLNAQQSENAQLVEEKQSINIDQIALMQAESAKISLVRQLLSSHLAVSNIFPVLSSLTAESVRYMTMDLTVPTTPGAPMQLAIAGYGGNLNSVAFQSDVLNHLDAYGLRNVVKNTIISNPGINQNGTVSFGFTAQVDPSTFLYSKKVLAPSAPVQTAPAAQSGQPQTGSTATTTATH